MEIDTGATLSVMSEATYKSLWQTWWPPPSSNLHCSTLNLHGWAYFCVKTDNPACLLSTAEPESRSVSGTWHRALPS